MPKTEKDQRDDATIKSLVALAYYEDDEPHKVRMTRAVELLKAQRDELIVLRDNLKAVAAELEKLRGKLAELLDESFPPEHEEPSDPKAHGVVR